MKLISTILFSFLVTFSFGGRKSELAIGYKIIKDTIDNSVDPGKCKISGVALYDGNPVAKALVQGEHTRSVRTNEKGEFVITLDTNENFVAVTWGSGKEGFIEYYKFKGGHSIKCEIYLRDWEEMIIVDKPVIYLYSDKEVKANVQLKTEMDLVFTYPVLPNDGWKVTVNSEGIKTENGSSYPYLFWEAETNEMSYLKEEDIVIGTVVKTDSIITYLENTLIDLGLNSTEKTDFITYWGPRMIQYEYVLTQFQVNEYLLEIAELDVTPKPDAMQRVFMLFTGFDAEPALNVLPQTFDHVTFKRKGFTLLEWGGSEISEDQLRKEL